jgi:protease-4
MSNKKIIALVALGVVFVCIVIAIVVPPAVGGGFGLTGRDSIALIRLSGNIQESGGTSILGGGGITPSSLRPRLQKVEKTPGIKAVVLRMDTGGGTVAASQEIAGMVRDFPKPVIVSMGDLTASGGYYIASQADAIVAQPGTLTGSIGVIWSTFNFEGLMEKIGVELNTVTAGRHKDMFLPKALTPEEREIIQGMVDNSYDQFVAAVASGRGMPEPTVRELATGRLFTGEQALDLGLVDKLGGLDVAIDEAESQAGISDAEIVELSPTLFEQLFGGSGVRSAVEVIRGNSSPVGQDLALLRQFLGGYSGLRY